MLDTQRRQLVLGYRRQALVKAIFESFGGFPGGSGGDRRKTSHKRGEGSRLVGSRHGKFQQLVDVQRRPLSLWTLEYERVVHGVR